MKKTDKNLYLLYMLFAVSLITANCIASKVFYLPFELFGAPVSLTVGALCYPVTFLCTDIISELWGREKANISVAWGFVCQIFSTIMIVIAQVMPATDAGVQQAYEILLGQQWVFVAASLVAYLASQYCGVFLFHKVRDWYVSRTGSTKGGKWIWNNCASIVSQFVDSALYAGIAFGLGFGWVFQADTRAALLNMILAQWLIKMLIAACDTPLFYLFTRRSSTYE